MAAFGLGPASAAVASHYFVSISLLMCGQTGHGSLDVVSGSTEKKKNFPLDLLGIILLMQAGKKLILAPLKGALLAHLHLFNRRPLCFSARLLFGQVRCTSATFGLSVY